MGLPLAGTYHTELSAYADLRTGDPGLAAGMELALGRFYGGCDRVLSPSRGSDRGWTARLVPGRIGRWGRGVDLDRFSPAAAPRAADGRIDVLYAGRGAREGVDLLADALLAPAARPAHPARAGRGRPRGGALEPGSARRRRSRLARGRRARRAYAAADLFRFCSQTDTFGQVVLEAQASGLPVVAVAAGGLAELIEDARSGVLCPAENPRGRRRRWCAPRARRPRPGWPAAASPPCAAAPGASRWPSWPPRGPPSPPTKGGSAVPHDPRLAVVLHGIEPATFEHCSLIREWLEDLGVDRVTLLRDPGGRPPHPFFSPLTGADGALAPRAPRQSGDAIAQQGFRPAAPAPRPDRASPVEHVRAFAAARARPGVEPRGYPARRRCAPTWPARVRGAVAHAFRLGGHRSPPAPLRARSACAAAAAIRIDVHPDDFDDRSSPHPARAREDAARAPPSAAAASPTTSSLTRPPPRFPREVTRVAPARVMKLLVLTPEPIDAVCCAPPPARMPPTRRSSS